METWYKIYLGADPEPIRDADTLAEAKRIARHYDREGWAVCIVKCEDWDELGIVWRNW